jgi:hypothetical protein
VQDAVQSRLGDVQSAILSPVEMMNKFLGTAGPPPRPRSESGSELEALRKRVAELEARLGKPLRRKRKKRANASS